VVCALAPSAAVVNAVVAFIQPAQVDRTKNTFLARSAEAAMKRAGTNIRPDQPTLAVVSDGPFRFTRNPLYLALTGLYVGITLLADALWPLLLLVPVLVVLQWGVVAREERYLEAKFGEPYRAYKARVRRWV
jgi:protein-S-isoprenylcysteine O-methyltransferase Ste14